MAPNAEAITEKRNGVNIEEYERPKPFKPKIFWLNVSFFLVLHLALLYGFYDIFYLMTITKAITLVYSLFVGAFGGIGITLGAHRLWAHRTYKAKLPTRLILLLAQTIAGQNCLWIWVRDHRMHHKYSETDADPHNSNRGFFFSHMGWLLMEKHPDLIEKGRKVDMADMNADPLIMFQKKYYNILYPIFAVILPVVIPVYVWNEAITSSILAAYVGRYLFGLHFTWCVNSVAHMYGSRPYDKNIRPVESTFVAIVALGEGWHNYHHTFPWDCEASELGKHFNLTTKILRKLEQMGQIYDCKRATKEMVIHRIKKLGDGSHPIY